MKNSAFNSDRNSDMDIYIDMDINLNRKKDFLAAYKPKSKKPTEITEDMTPEEIVEFVTDRLMDNIRAQFAETKRRYLAEKAKLEEMENQYFLGHA